MQTGILAPVPAAARHLFFEVASPRGVVAALRALRGCADGNAVVVGIGQSVTQLLRREVDGLRAFPSMAGPGFEVPSTSAALWCWLRGADRGELLHRSRAIAHGLAPGFRLSQAVDAFRHRNGLDLTGYEDGTENPKGKAAVSAAFAHGASFAAVQQWVHDFDRFGRMTPRQQDHAIGRRRRDNKELAAAPASAHVKRTAQESFEPEAFVLRRSMPWSDATRAGLVFLAFGRSFDAFEAQLRRMCGQDDGIADALFGFTRPETGAYFWCPPMHGARLDLRALGVR